MPAPIKRKKFENKWYIEDMYHLDWISQDGIVVVIYDGKDFMKNNKNRESVITYLEELADWWGEDRPIWCPDDYPNRYKDPILDECDGKWRRALPFDVYIVD